MPHWESNEMDDDLAETFWQSVVGFEGREMSAVLREFEEDEENGVWHWYVMTSTLVDKARQTILQLPRTVFIRSGDALHLTCAEENGFREVYTNDRHMLTAARHFRLKGVNVIGER